MVCVVAAQQPGEASAQPDAASGEWGERLRQEYICNDELSHEPTRKQGAPFHGLGGVLLRAATMGWVDMTGRRSSLWAKHPTR